MRNTLPASPSAEARQSFRLEMQKTRLESYYTEGRAFVLEVLENNQKAMTEKNREIIRQLHGFDEDDTVPVRTAVREAERYAELKLME